MEFSTPVACLLLNKTHHKHNQFAGILHSLVCLLYKEWTGWFQDLVETAIIMFNLMETNFKDTRDGI